MPLPPHEIGYASDGNISYVKIYESAEKEASEMIYEPLRLSSPPQKKAAIYAVTRKELPANRKFTGTTIPFNALPPLLQKIFQTENRDDLETLIRSDQIRGFVVKP